MALKFLWNGIKGSDKKLQKCTYYGGPWVHGIDPGTIGITSKSYEPFSAEIREVFKVTNGTDSQSDHFETDRIKVVPNHPLYRDVQSACKMQEQHREQMIAKYQRPDK